MEIKEFEKQLSKVADIHENMNEKIDYIKWFRSFNIHQQHGIIQAWELILKMYEKELTNLNLGDINVKPRADEIKRIIDICLEQIIWIIEFKGMGATGIQEHLIDYEKPMYEAFENIKTEKDIETFKYYTIRYFAKFH